MRLAGGGGTLSAMNDHDTLLRAALEDPNDLARRLVYADWLLDYGDATVGQFVQLHVEMLRTSKVNPRFEQLEATIAEGWKRHWQKVVGVGLLPGMLVELSCGIDCAARVSWPLSRSGQAEVVFWVRGGMVEHVATNMELFLSGARELFSRHPITSVEINNKDSIPELDDGHNQTGRAWVIWARAENVDSYSHFWPAVMAPEYAGREGPFYYPSEPEATTDLRRRCLAWGRKQAGLPPLPVRKESTQAQTVRP